MSEFAEEEKAILSQVASVGWPDAPPGVCEPDKEIPCDICGSERNIELWPKKNLNQSVRTVICEDCGLPLGSEDHAKALKDCPECGATGATKRW